MGFGAGVRVRVRVRAGVQVRSCGASGRAADHAQSLVRVKVRVR